MEDGNDTVLEKSDLSPNLLQSGSAVQLSTTSDNVVPSYFGCTEYSTVTTAV